MNETVGSHQEVPVATGISIGLHHAVSKVEILLRVLEERLDAPAHFVGANRVFGRCVDLVRGEVLDRICFVFVGLFSSDDQLHVTQLGDGWLLRPDMVDLLIHIASDRVDAFCQRINADLFAAIGKFAVAPERADPVVVVGFDVFTEPRVVSGPRVEEVSVPADTYLFFEFDDDLAGKIVLRVVVLVVLVLLFVEAEAKR